MQEVMQCKLEDPGLLQGGSQLDLLKYLVYAETPFES
jgi:hypothetical protein